jgi:hypothetical protein
MQSLAARSTSLDGAQLRYSLSDGAAIAISHLKPGDKVLATNVVNSGRLLPGDNCHPQHLIGTSLQQTPQSQRIPGFLTRYLTRR